jgi:hypothetical protein
MSVLAQQQVCFRGKGFGGASIAAEAAHKGDGGVFVGAGLPAILGASFAAEATYKGGGGISVGAGLPAIGARIAGKPAPTGGGGGVFVGWVYPRLVRLRHQHRG